MKNIKELIAELEDIQIAIGWVKDYLDTDISTKDGCDSFLVERYEQKILVQLTLNNLHYLIKEYSK